ncbi:MAG: hypothetical protein QOJ12_1921 [Thermoleophilales bacterium]|jgi:uncharacterized protein (DUF427 family)|nr:hypothetical protein [Thermoleophilales bacterium]
MTMTVGTGPLGHRPAGVFNRPMPDLKGLIYFEDFSRRIRGEFAGETVVDSRHGKLLHEHGLLPIAYFPEDEVRMDLFEPSDKHTKCPWKGQASYWSVRVGDQVAKDAAWYYPEPLEGAPPIKGYVAFYFDRLDRWLEEDEELIAHVRDPYHRVDVLDSSRHVKVSLDGVVLAETDHPKALYETGLPVRWYIPPEDVRMDLLTPTDKQTLCAYKGQAGYHSANVDGKVAEDLVWHYAEPRREAERIRDHLSFYNERVDIEVDGEPQ